MTFSLFVLSFLYFDIVMFVYIYTCTYPILFVIFDVIIGVYVFIDGIIGVFFLGPCPR